MRFDPYYPYCEGPHSLGQAARFSPEDCSDPEMVEKARKERAVAKEMSNRSQIFHLARDLMVQGGRDPGRALLDAYEFMRLVEDELGGEIEV